MNISCPFLLLMLISCFKLNESVSLRQKRQTLPKEFENVNLEGYFKNKGAMRFQLKCLLDNGPCDRIGTALKDWIPALVKNMCVNCDETTKTKAKQLLLHIQQFYPQDWERSVKKFTDGPITPKNAALFKRTLGITIEPHLITPGDGEIDWEIEEVSTTSPSPPPPPPVEPHKPEDKQMTSPYPDSDKTTEQTVLASLANGANPISLSFSVIFLFVLFFITA